MKRQIWLRQLMGFAIASLLGTVLHFLYVWLGEAVWIAPFSGVNESTWEHMKLLFWPMLLYAVVESFFFRLRADFWCVKARGILTGIILIPVLFYTYNGVIGTSPDFVNIAIFFVSVALSYVYETKQFKKGTAPCNKNAAIGTLLIIATLFAIFTFFPPSLEIFVSPV